MKRIVWLFLGCTVLMLSGIGCSKNVSSHAAGGAAAGAGGAMFVGALTDLIIDGKVDPYRLQRNAVSGAIVGGAGGAAVGHQKDKAEEKAEKLKESNISKDDAARLRDRIGDDNFNGVKSLLACDHESAYRLTLKTVESEKNEYKKAGIVLQALIDKDRGNQAGVDDAVGRYMEVAAEDVNDKATAVKELNNLYSQLQDERRIKGLSPSCTQ